LTSLRLIARSAAPNRESERIRKVSLGKATIDFRGDHVIEFVDWLCNVRHERMTDAYGHRVQAPRTKAIDKVVSDGDFGMGKLSRGWSETSHTSVSSRTYSPTSDRSVTFGDVEVCEFLPTIGDNPSVSSGVPVALSFDLERRTILRLDSYEENRSPRRKGKSLMIPREVREDM